MHASFSSKNKINCSTNFNRNSSDSHQTVIAILKTIDISRTRVNILCPEFPLLKGPDRWLTLEKIGGTRFASTFHREYHNSCSTIGGDRSARRKRCVSALGYRLPIIYNETPYLLLPGEIDYCLLFPRQRIKFHACKSYGFNIAVAERSTGMQQITLLPYLYFFFFLFWSTYLLTKLCFSTSACRRATIHFQPSSRTCFQTYANIAANVK